MKSPIIDNKVKSVILNIRNLPTPPIVFDQIQKAINDPNVDATRVANILAEDPAMSVKVLRLTNSAYYGLTNEVESVKQAVTIVGFEAIKNLILSASVFDMFRGKVDDQESQENYWRHSLSTAVCCRILAQKYKQHGEVTPDTAFSAGLLHDIGKMVMTTFLPDEYARYKAVRKIDTVRMDHKIEEELFGYTHAQIGGFLGVQWKIPYKLVEAIIYHHDPLAYPEPDPLIYITYLADHISKITFSKEEQRLLEGRIEPEIYQYFDITDEDISELSTLLKEEYANSETFIHLVGS